MGRRRLTDVGLGVHCSAAGCRALSSVGRQRLGRCPARALANAAAGSNGYLGSARSVPCGLAQRRLDRRRLDRRGAAERDTVNAARARASVGLGALRARTEFCTPHRAALYANNRVYFIVFGAKLFSRKPPAWFKHEASARHFFSRFRAHRECDALRMRAHAQLSERDAPKRERWRCSAEAPDSTPHDHSPPARDSDETGRLPRHARCAASSGKAQLP